MVDIARALASERGDGTRRGHAVLGAATRRTIESHRRRSRRSRRSAAPPWRRAFRPSKRPRGRWRSRWTSAFCSIPTASCCRSAIAWPKATLDPSCYDLLASEARLASFIAIAKGDVPARHWFRLGRAVTPVAHGAALISWSGSMFEYLMPSLVMRAPAGSLLEQTSRLIVRRQIAYGATLGLPWGISESAYNARDLEFTYQYSNFGVPGLGLKRGLGEERRGRSLCDRACRMVDPRGRGAQLRAAGRASARSGRYGFYEALDYTPSRVPEDASVAIVRAFMAHHQGMTIVAIADALLDGAMRARFHAEPIIQATELLLQERMPRDVAVARPWAAEVKSAAGRARTSVTRRPATGQPRTAASPPRHLLSNGRYAVMLTAAGSGYSRWRRYGGHALARRCHLR